MRHLIYLGFIFITFACADTPEYEAAILEQTEGMEAAWRSGDKLGVAAYYADDGYIINPEGIEAQGRAQVDAYWRDFRGTPVDWQLTNYALSPDFADIEAQERWAAVGDDIRHWTADDIALPADPVYQLGQSLLVRERVDGRVDTSTVDFLIVWKQVEDDWRIYVDTYE